MNNKEIFNEDNPNKGHRKRLKERFLISKDSLQDYELLEMLLFLAFSRKDTKDLSKLLLNKFKTLKNVINADENQLRSINGIGDSVIVSLKLVHEIHNRILKKNIKPNEIKISNMKSAIKYFRSKIGNMVNEYVLILYLNNSNEIVFEDIITNESNDSVSINKNTIITQATQNGSTSIIMVHNHPSGNITPSVSDIEFTKDLKSILEKLNINLLDHIIVTKDNSFSCMKFV